MDQSRKKILVVDDEQDIVRALTIRLRSNGYEVIPAFDGEEAVLLAHKDNPDLVILDIRMPAGDGFSAAERLKQSEHTRHIPVIFLTGSPDRSAEGKAAALGARFYIKKPYDAEELLDAVRRALAAEAPDV